MPDLPTLICYGLLALFVAGLLWARRQDLGDQ